MDSCGFLETFSWLIASSNDQEQRKVLKVESLKDLGLLANFPTLSLVLVKMRSPYQPANPKIKLMEKFKFNILLIAEEDWHRVSFTTNFIVGYCDVFNFVRNNKAHAGSSLRILKCGCLISLFAKRLLCL